MFVYPIWQTFQKTILKNLNCSEMVRTCVCKKKTLIDIHSTGICHSCLMNFISTVSHIEQPDNYYIEELSVQESSCLRYVMYPAVCPSH